MYPTGEYRQQRKPKFDKNYIHHKVASEELLA
jgi:hypothetical protein